MGNNQTQKPVIGIIGGTGQMGQFFKRVFERDGLRVLINGRRTPLTRKALCTTAHIVIVSVPIPVAPRIIRTTVPLLRPTQLLVDFSSLKEKTMYAMAARRGPFVGIHPLFGPGVPNLHGQTFVFCYGQPNRWEDFLRSFFRAKGAKIIDLDPEEHDRHMAAVQSAVHVLNLVFGATLAKRDARRALELSTPTFRMQAAILHRMLAAPPDLYASIAIENPYVLPILKRMCDAMECVTAVIREKRYHDFRSAFQKIVAAYPHALAPTKAPLIRERLEAKKGVAYLGPPGTYSFLAARKLFRGRLTQASTVTDVFELVDRGDVAYGVVPADNVIEGSVRETEDAFLDYDVQVTSMYTLPVRHVLVSNDQKLSDIRVVRSHPSALRQCRAWLQAHLPRARLEETRSTVAGLALRASRGTAWIVPEETAMTSGLSLLARDISDIRANATRFFVIRKDVISAPRRPHLSILLLAVQDRVGVLRDILDVFASAGLNLRKLESRPSRTRIGEFSFFVEIDIVGKVLPYRRALKEIEPFCHTIRVLGEV